MEGRTYNDCGLYLFKIVFLTCGKFFMDQSSILEHYLLKMMTYGKNERKYQCVELV